MARYADLVQEVMREAPEAPASMIESEVRAAVIEFCQRSQSWKQAEPVAVDALEGDIPLRGFDNGRVAQILVAQFAMAGSAARLLRKTSRASMLVSNFEPGTPRFFCEEPNRVHLYPAPAEPGMLVIQVVLVPQRSSASFPDFIDERWRPALVAGTSARLLMHSNKPWTNETKAQVLQRSFDLAIRDARQNAASDQWTPQSIQLRRWV